MKNYKKKEKIFNVIVEGVLLLLSLTIIIPFVFALLNSFKSSKEASWMNMQLPSEFHIIENYKTAFVKGNILNAFINSSIVTIGALIILIIVSSLAAYVLNRNSGKFTNIFSFLVLAGLIVPPAIVPTIWIMRALHIYNTKFALILMEVVLQFSFSTILFKGFFSTIPRELDEAAIVDGTNRWQLFYKIILPLLKPVTITICILSGITIFNDFTNPLYFLSGADNTTIQLTVYYFFGLYNAEWNLVFATVMIISIPPLILYLFFNKKIIGGMTAGAIKG